MQWESNTHYQHMDSPGFVLVVVKQWRKTETNEERRDSERPGKASPFLRIINASCSEFGG